MTTLLSTTVIDDVPFAAGDLPAHLFRVTYTPDDGVNLTYGEAVAFYPTADSPAGYDLEGEYYGSFDAYRIVQERAGMTVQVRVIRLGSRLWLPMTNVFKLRDAENRIPPKGRRL